MFFRRHGQRTRNRILLLLLVAFLFDALYMLTSQPLPKRTGKLSPPLVSQKVFIASIARNSEYMMRMYWNDALLDLCTFLGPQNVFVSIVESGSQDDTKGALRFLGERLNERGVENRITLLENQWEQIAGLETIPEEGKRQGWVHSGWKNQTWEKRRIPALAELRNRAMQPLVENTKKKWERLLWINDVVFTNEDIATLLSTRDGDYAAACALDFSKTAKNYYDTFALRDSAGHPTLFGKYPYFHSSSSLNALQKLHPIPVQSCWNGVVAFDASPFYPASSSSEYTHHETYDSASEHQAGEGMSNNPELHPRSNSLPTQQVLQFRGIPDSLAQRHIEGSECCLIHSDNPLRATKGVWVNPNVRVTFNESTYALVNPGLRIPGTITSRPDIMAQLHQRSQGPEGSAMRRGQWPGHGELFWGTWSDRIGRWLRWLVVLSQERMVNKRVEKWISEGKKSGEARGEVGRECLINEMQVLYKSGWMHR